MGLPLKPKTEKSDEQKAAKKQASKAAKEEAQGFSILLPKSMHKALKQRALDEETTVSELIRQAVEKQYFKIESND